MVSFNGGVTVIRGVWRGVVYKWRGLFIKVVVRWVSTVVQ